MQSFNFDLWGIFVALLVFFNSCGTEETTIQSHSQELVLPTNADEFRTDYSKVSTKLTLILLEGGRTYAYEGLNLNGGDLYEKREIRNVIRAAKQKFPRGKFVVLIKPTTKTDYGGTVAVLDEMTINKIDRHSIDKLSPEESKKLRVESREEY